MYIVRETPEDSKKIITGFISFNIIVVGSWNLSKATSPSKSTIEVYALQIQYNTSLTQYFSDKHKVCYFTEIATTNISI